jgi:hypothetical protein
MSSKSEDETKPRRNRSVKPSVVKDADSAPQQKAKRGRAAKAVVVAKTDDDSVNDEESPSKPEKKPRTKATPHQTLTERDEATKTLES